MLKDLTNPIPKTLNEMTIQYLSPPDRLGRYRFVLRWCTTYIPGRPLPPPTMVEGVPVWIRGQQFFADPLPYFERAKEKGTILREVL